MTFADLLKSRRSVRNYRDKSVPLDMIKEMIKESTLAPNAGNEQPWKFIIVNDKEMLKISLPALLLIPMIMQINTKGCWRMSPTMYFTMHHVW